VRASRLPAQVVNSILPSDDRGNIERMRDRPRFELALSAVAVLALGLALAALARYGDVYRVGDSEYRHTGLSDQLAYLIPALVFAGCVGSLALRRLCGGSIAGQWARDRELLRDARRQG
jgi:hypothetical protein